MIRAHFWTSFFGVGAVAISMDEEEEKEEEVKEEEEGLDP